LNFHVHQTFYLSRAQIKALGKFLQDMTLAEMDIYWEEAKEL